MDQTSPTMENICKVLTILYFTIKLIGYTVLVLYALSVLDLRGNINDHVHDEQIVMLTMIALLYLYMGDHHVYYVPKLMCSTLVFCILMLNMLSTIVELSQFNLVIKFLGINARLNTMVYLRKLYNHHMN